MAKKETYSDILKRDFVALVDSLNLAELQKHFLKARWLDQLLWMEGKAAKSRDHYHRLRLITILGGVLIPAFVSLSSISPARISDPANPNRIDVNLVISWSTFVLSQVVAICAATEQFFNYGEQWYNYRRSAELLKTQGWQFFQLSGAYTHYANHEEAFDLFVEEVEEIIQRDVEVYVTRAKEKKQQSQSELPMVAKRTTTTTS